MSGRVLRARRSRSLRIIALAMVAAGPGPLLAQRPARARPQLPALVVMVAVDQLRGDLLDAYDPLFTGGFRRLRDEGRRFTRATVDHAITVSHPGHVTLATGRHPSHHGIVDGAWREFHDGKWVTVDPVLDSTTRIVGWPALFGASPHRLVGTALPDWIRAADTAARVFALGVGQYASVLHAGQQRGDVYWFDSRAGRFITSTWYRNDYPAWLTEAQDRLLTELSRDSAWAPLEPARTSAFTLPDLAPWESDGVHTAFPHRFVDEVPVARQSRPRALVSWQKGLTPFPDVVALRLAGEAVGALALGQRGHTDYLSLVLSQVDEIGHTYGPRSREQLETLLRLDRALGDFLHELDARVGLGRYVIALSADHGVAEVPEGPLPPSVRGRRVPWSDVEALFTAIDSVAPARGRAIDATSAARVAALVRRRDWVADVTTIGTLEGSPSRDPFVRLYQHSYMPGRRMRLPLFSPTSGVALTDYGLVARLTEGTILDFDPGVHFSPYGYDRAVPLVFMGAGVTPGVSVMPARTVDVAPTLAHLAGLAVPAKLDGRVLRVR